MDIPSSLDIHLLGPFSVAVDGKMIDESRWQRRKPKLLLKLLALQPHHRLHREQIMELLWPESDVQSATNSLHKALHMARHALESDLKSGAESSFLVLPGQEIVLQAPGKLWIDIEEFERQTDVAIRSLDLRDTETALDLYGGDLLTEDTYEEWAVRRREQLRELHHRLLRQLSKIHESRSEYVHSIEALQRLVAEDPSDEETHRNLMKLYALAGNRHQALRQYKYCVESLRKELDAEPEPQTLELHRQIESGTFQQRKSTIAILPLVNESADPEMDYFSDGLTETIINNLSQLLALRVMAWGTVAHYKGRKISPVEAGRELGVSAVVTGRVLQPSQRFVVRVELIDSTDGALLWGGHYNRELAEIFAVQEEIAAEISENLRLKLTGEEKKRLAKRHTENTAAYQAYLKGRYYWNKRDATSLKKGVEQFRLAIDLDPSYAQAYVGLSDSYTLLVVREAIPPEDGFAKAKAAAAVALNIDDGVAEAHASLGHAMLHNWEWNAAEKEFRKAIELNASYPSAHHWYSEYLTAKAEFDEAVKEAKRSEELDPLSLIITSNVADVLYFARRYDQGIAQAQRALELSQEFWLTHLIMGKCYLKKNAYAEAVRSLQKAGQLSAGNTEVISLLGFAHASDGRRGEALKLLRDLTEQAKQGHVPHHHLAIIHAGIQETDKALNLLERAFEQHAVDLFLLKVEPMFDVLRSDPRFLRLLRQVGLS